MVAAVDVCLRHVAAALLDGTDGEVATAAAADLKGVDQSGALASCLGYLRDRIGVPRDMGQAAALELRAHLNWAMSQM